MIESDKGECATLKFIQENVRPRAKCVFHDKGTCTGTDCVFVRISNKILKGDQDPEKVDRVFARGERHLYNRFAASA